MKQTLQQAIDAKIALKLYMQEANELELRIIEQKQQAFALTEKIAFLTAYKHLLQQQIDTCGDRPNWSLQLLEQQLKQMQYVDLILSDILHKLDVNQLNGSDIELVRLLGEVM